MRAVLADLSPDALGIAEAALRACPADSALLLLAALAALVAGQPDRAIGFLKRFERKFEADKAVTLLTALALARKGYTARAWTLLEQDGLLDPYDAIRWFIGGRAMAGWLVTQLAEIRTDQLHEQRKVRQGMPRAATGKPTGRPAPRAVSARTKPATAVEAPSSVPDLPRLEVSLGLAFEFGDADAIQVCGGTPEPAWFRLRGELTQLGLVEGFDELLCLPTLQGVEAHWYQIETVRKVLKQYRGRVLLADEVGLGKTVEAGMVVKEYLLRGMVERLLILVPAPLVGQWRDEMATKFGIDCATTHDSLARSDPGAFWGQPRIIASIAMARRREHADLLVRHPYDVVVVDEAHHLRDQASASYRLVNVLQKRFLLLLSATPVQNSLLELYHLLTLLQPGIFRTQKEFRSAYMTPGKPREPANQDRLRALMRGVMVRNTRALAALRLPRRHATTIRATPDAAEAACYQELTALTRSAATGGQARLAVQHLLSAAGSSPAAAAGAVARFAERHPDIPGWAALLTRYRAASAGAKQTALLKLLAENPTEKKMVFVHHRDSMTHLAGLLRRQGLAPLLFDGSMSGPEKDAAVAAFRETGTLLLCSESGGEGRNLQFCNTLVNFDIPWNPMAIEQRIGRIDRIGQTREVFVFNLVTAGTIEDAMLRILDEKINMFELVVGEVGAILGEIDEQQDFPSLVLDAWLQNTEEARTAAFDALEGQLLAARRQYEDARQLDEALFGNDLDAA
ncbi:SNF2-related protein [Paeniroseomonas aquatica]|uniref:SNF2-related protein n=1 Tax=Paeniroseomonas aquatica TaxID=373043 RepID=A0ABT8A2L0_9PROT|nr:SNF2-related protein [Paeniroseomonas aquatica]MDN3563898.1 SNF2-related protein [Paeniroseomonas aquatica]